MKKKKVAVAVGVAFGIVGSILAMIPTTNHSKANVAVWDEKNIAQAIEIVSRTTSILNDEDKKLALAILNAKKLDSNMIMNYVNANLKNATHNGFGWTFGSNSSDLSWGKLDELYRHTGGGAKSGTTAAVEAAWKSRLGDLQSVLNGSTTIAGAAMNEYNREKALDQMYLEAATTAQKSQDANQEILKTTNQLLEDSSNAEGEVQLLQLNNNIAGQNVFANVMLSRLIARSVQSEVAYRESKNLKEAQIRVNEEKARKRALEAAGISSSE